MKTDMLMNFSVDKENNKINVTRAFAAPLETVWSAWTEAQLLDQWWAPKPWKTETRSMDFRVGGYWLYAMVGPDGTRHWCRLDYGSVVPLDQFSGIDSFCDESGTPNESFPSARWINRFSATGEVTTVEIDIQYEKLADLESIMEMGFQEGFTAGMENLDALLQSY